MRENGAVEPTLDDVIDFVRRFTGVRPEREVIGATRLEADLGVTGDDGLVLITDAEAWFERALVTPDEGVRGTFGLGSDEYLFGPEGFDLFRLGALARWLRRKPPPVIRDLTVAELHAALVHADPLPPF